MKREGQNVFNIMTGVAVAILVKKPESIGNASIYYYDIGDYLNRKQKFEKISNFKSVNSVGFEKIVPNEHGDWISQRSEAFSSFIPLSEKTDTIAFWKNGIYCRGLESSRDSFVYQSNKEVLKNNVIQSIDFFNSEVSKFRKVLSNNSKAEAKDYVTYDDKKISWSRAFLTDINNFKSKMFQEANIRTAIYRPFFKQNLYFSPEMNNIVSRMDAFFPSVKHSNLLICISGLGGKKTNSTFISNSIIDLNCLDAGTQCFPYYFYEKAKHNGTIKFDNSADSSDYTRHDAISDYIHKLACEQYGKSVLKEDIFYYVYGFLHSPEYRETFAADLKKMLPRLPLVDNPDDFWAFSKSGRELADLHLKYENTGRHPAVIETTTSPQPSSASLLSPEDFDYYRVEQMRYPSKAQKDTIFYNSRITIENIPAVAYEYIVNGKSAIEWIMERYAITTHKESGIRNDPNDWAKETGNPRYIIDLLHSVINLSVKTVEIVKSLPILKFEE